MQRLAVVSGRINGWYCSYCNGYNDLVTGLCIYCNDCRAIRDYSLNTLAFVTQQSRLGGIFTLREPLLDNESTMTDDKRKELHQEFYNAFKPLVIEIADINELVELVEKLERIAAEGKANLRCAGDELRERTAKLSKEERDKLLSQDSRTLTGSDALNSVQKRKDRMTKADKTAESMAKLGFSDELIRDLMRKANDKPEMANFTAENPDKIKEAEDRQKAEVERIKQIEAQEKIESKAKKQAEDKPTEPESKPDVPKPDEDKPEDNNSWDIFKKK